MDLFDALSVWHETHADFNKSDMNKATQRNLDRNEVLLDVLEGRRSSDEFLDILTDQGGDVGAYCKGVHDLTEAVIDGNIVYLTNESGILLPEGLVM